MVSWRERSLEQVTGGLLDKDSLTEASIQALVEQVPGESELLDFKSSRTFEAHSREKKPNVWTQMQERAKDIVSFANSRGGMLVFGVNDGGASAAEDRLQPLDSDGVNAAIEKYRKDVRAYSHPIPLFDMFAVPAANGGFYVVAVVPPSALAPHAVRAGTDDRPTFMYPVRASGESHTRFLPEFEIADRYRGRFRSSDDRIRRANQIWDSGVQTVRDGSDDIWMMVSVSPDAPVDETLTVAVRREISDWGDRQQFPSGTIGVHAPSRDSFFPGPGYVEFTQLVSGPGTLNEPAPVSAYRALYADGSGFAALRIGYHPANLAPTVLVQDDLIDALTACVPHLIEWVGHRCGQWGNVTLSTAIVDAGTEDDTFENEIRIDTGTHAATYGTRPARRPRRVLHSVDLAESLTMQQRLAITYPAAAAVVQMFGLTEPDLLTETGSVRTIGYPTLNYRSVEQWCADRGVPLDEKSWPDSPKGR